MRLDGEAGEQRELEVDDATVAVAVATLAVLSVVFFLIVGAPD